MAVLAAGVGEAEGSVQVNGELYGYHLPVGYGPGYIIGKAPLSGCRRSARVRRGLSQEVDGR